MAIDFRPAIATDALGITEFHVRIWRETYSSFAPHKAIKLLTVKRRLPVWQADIDTPQSCQHSLIALKNRQIVGLIKFGPAGDKVFGDSAEIKHLYVDGDIRGLGVGRQLLLMAFDQIKQDGFTTVALAVAHQNQNAIRFYLKMGGIVSGSFIDSGPIWRSENKIILWKELRLSTSNKPHNPD